MPLQLTRPPTTILDDLRRDLKDRAEQRTFLLPAMRGAVPSSLAVSTWHVLYSVDEDELSASASLRKAAAFAGWRGLIHGAGSRPIAMAVQSAPDGEGSARFTLSEGDEVNDFVSAIALAESALADDETGFDLTAVEIRSLYLTALWIQAATPADDRLIVYSAGYGLDGLAPLAFLDLPTFLSSVRRMLTLLPDEDYV